jgi:hypothetical protein
MGVKRCAPLDRVSFADMTSKVEFNAEEWQKVVEGPAIAGLIVIAAQRGGTIRESVHMARAYTEARKLHGDTDLLGEIVATPPSIDAKRFQTQEALRNTGLAHIREAVELLEGKATPDELEEYRRFTLTVGQAAAEADKSGGFLGIGGERVSDTESAALDQIAEALGTTRD